MSTSITVSGGPALTRLERKIRDIAGIRLDDLLDSLGTLIEDQTKIRIADTKKSPRGRDWPPWSKKYERTRHSGHSRLRDEGHLLESIQHIVSLSGGVGTLQVGSNVKYAAAHQFGLGVPMRRFLGLSLSDKREVETELRDWMKKLIR